MLFKSPLGRRGALVDHVAGWRPGCHDPNRKRRCACRHELDEHDAAWHAQGTSLCALRHPQSLESLSMICCGCAPFLAGFATVTVQDFQYLSVAGGGRLGSSFIQWKTHYVSQSRQQLPHPPRRALACMLLTWPMLHWPANIVDQFDRPSADHARGGGSVRHVWVC